MSVFRVCVEYIITGIRLSRRSFFYLSKTGIAINLRHINIKKNIRRQINIAIQDLERFFGALGYQTYDRGVDFANGITEDLDVFFVVIDIKNRHRQ